jgi:hypothetical protein
MSEDRSIIAVPPSAFAAIVDAIQHAIVDKGASKATRKAAFSALLALIDAGLIVATRSTNSAARDETGAVRTHVGATQLLAGHQG